MSECARPARPPSTYAVVTLGCRANQYDGAAMAADLAAAGLRATGPERADVVVVNTCMVTEATEARCRRMVNRVRRRNSDARLVVAGCMSAGDRAQVRSWGGIDLVVPPSERGNLPAGLGLPTVPAWTDWPPAPAVQGANRTRAILKIQDGCDGGCSFCVVPSVRGPSRSLPPEAVLAALADLESRAFPEVTLSGVHLGVYGADLPGSVSLAGLLVRVLGTRRGLRVRLSSIEPMEVGDDLLSAASSADGRICRHLHLPLQSGSDRILESMGRPYTADAYAAVVRRIRRVLPGVGIGCDVICGYPGESEEDFARTEELVRTLDIPFLHPFPFSPRRGTAAATLDDPVPPRVKKERVRRIRSIGRSTHREFLRSFVGRTLEVVMERFGSGRGRIGLADNYIRVRLSSRVDRTDGRLLVVRCTSLTEDLLLAEPLADGLHG